MISSSISSHTAGPASSTKWSRRRWRARRRFWRMVASGCRCRPRVGGRWCRLCRWRGRSVGRCRRAVGRRPGGSRLVRRRSVLPPDRWRSPCVRDRRPGLGWRGGGPAFGNGGTRSRRWLRVSTGPDPRLVMVPGVHGCGWLSLKPTARCRRPRHPLSVARSQSVRVRTLAPSG